MPGRGRNNMANFIPTSNNSWQQILGNAAGTGLATEHYSTRDILDNLAKEKALNAQAKHYRTLNPNISLEQAQALVRQPPAVQQAAFGFQPQQQQQPQQLQGPQQQQMPQQMQRPQMPSNALQLLQGQQQRQPSIAELEFLRRLPKPMRNQVGGGIPQEQMQEPQQAPQQMQQAPVQPQQAPVAPQGPNLGEFIGQKLAKPGPKSQEQISKEDQQFGLDLSKRIDYAPKILRGLDEIDKLVEKKDIQWGLIASKAPVSQLNDNTKKLVNKFAQVLAQQVQSAGQGRGSDLLRNIIKEGKFTLEQGPSVWRDVSAGLREDTEYDEKLYKARHDILKEYGGKPPAELAYLTRERVANQTQQEGAHKQSLQNWAQGSEINDLPANDTPEAKALEGRALDSPHGPIIYFGGKQYPAVKKNGKWGVK